MSEHVPGAGAVLVGRLPVVARRALLLDCMRIDGSRLIPLGGLPRERGSELRHQQDTEQPGRDDFLYRQHNAIL